MSGSVQSTGATSLAHPDNPTNVRTKKADLCKRGFRRFDTFVPQQWLSLKHLTLVHSIKKCYLRANPKVRKDDLIDRDFSFGSRTSVLRSAAHFRSTSLNRHLAAPPQRQRRTAVETAGKRRLRSKPQPFTGGARLLISISAQHRTHASLAPALNPAQIVRTTLRAIFSLGRLAATAIAT